MKQETYYSLLCACVFFLSLRTNADIISYVVNIDSGFADTSGGITGRGMGIVPISGSFKLNIDYDSNHAALENIDISLTPLNFDWNRFTGIINGSSISLVAPTTRPAFPFDDTLQGTFNGSSGSLSGTIYERVYDGYQYDCHMTISQIPEPSTVALLGGGGMVIFCVVTRRIKESVPAVGAYGDPHV